MPRTILILGGTAEAYGLAADLAARPGLGVVSSLAGRTAAPRLPAGEVRLGGFGGIDGLATYLRDQQVAAVIDATHPFAAVMGWNAARACAETRVPLLRLERPAWTPRDGDRWDEVDEWSEATAVLARHSARVLLAVGRQDLAPFATLDRIWFLIRAVTAPEPLPPFAQARVMLARGPFTPEAERALLTVEAIDTVVCKNSGGPADAKLEAARTLGLRVVMRRRPPRPETAAVATVADAVGWIFSNL